jgi:glutamyl/glutaminyl-tRNA synthetase
VVLRLENLDPQRCLPEYNQSMIDELAWFGLDWDEVVWQDQRRSEHEQALDALVGAGLLYPCSCSRARLKASARPAPDGGFAYDNFCRHRLFPDNNWRRCDEPLRVRLSDDTVSLVDDGGLVIEQTPGREMGDPVVRRRDGAIAYHLACVVDDAAMAATHLIRGSDLAPSAPVQILLQRMLGLPTPRYRHHFLLMEKNGDKLAKFHQSVAVPELARCYTAKELCGWLAYAANLQPESEPVCPSDLIPTFNWSGIRRENIAVEWDGKKLAIG